MAFHIELNNQQRKKCGFLDFANTLSWLERGQLEWLWAFFLVEENTKQKIKFGDFSTGKKQCSKGEYEEIVGKRKFGTQIPRKG